jgi:hypothetical protein
VSRQEALISGDGLKGKLICNFLEPVYNLLSFALLHDSVFLCLKSLVTCLDDRLKPQHAVAATCLRLAVMSSAANEVDVEMMTSFCVELHNIVVRNRGSTTFTPSTVLCHTKFFFFLF